MPWAPPSARLEGMLTEKFLQNALTSLLSETVEEQGRAFFVSLRNSGLCSEDEVTSLEQDWKLLVEQRRADGASSAESLSNLLNKINMKAVGQRLTRSEED